MIPLSLFPALSFLVSYLIHHVVDAQMLGTWSSNHAGLQQRQNSNSNNGNGQNNRPDTSAFNIVNGRIFTPGLGIILAVRLPIPIPSPQADENTSLNPLRQWVAISYTLPSTSPVTANSPFHLATSPIRLP